MTVVASKPKTPQKCASPTKPLKNLRAAVSPCAEKSIDFRTGEMDWTSANASWYSADTIAATLGAGVSAGVGSYAKSFMAANEQGYMNRAIMLGASISGWSTEYTTHLAANMIMGEGLDSFAKAWEDIGGLTLNIANLGTLLWLLTGDENLASLTNVGLLELNIGGDGPPLSFGTGGIDFEVILTTMGVLRYASYQAAKDKHAELVNKELGENDITKLEDFIKNFETWTGDQTVEEILHWYNTEINPEYQLTEYMLMVLFDEKSVDNAKTLLLGFETLHKDLRNKLNEKVPVMLTEEWGEKARFLENIFHNPIMNLKYLELNGYLEGIYNQTTGILATDSRFMGTFNFFPSTANKTNATTNHWKVDIVPYFLWGN